jgi:acyl-[acyl carrier protein]--UDP-N-acetylglucosamine O-acyltransferase
LQLKAAYRLLFRSGKNLRAAIAEAQTKFPDGPARTLVDFVVTAKRGVCSDVSHSRDLSVEN